MDITNAINWAWNQGQADVLSNSWGYLTSSQTEPGFDAIIQAINNARTQGRGGRGAPVIFASGNNFGTINDVAFPANVNGVITVGACNNAAPSGDIWYYSERGSSMDLVAPSGDVNLNGDVVTLDRMGAFGYEPGNYTFRFGGTSAACPEVSGVAALMLAINPNLTEAQVTNILQTTATDMGDPGFDNTFGYGRVNACSAVGQALTSSIVSGDDYFCNTSNNYTIPNLSAGATIQWQASPQGVVNINSPTSPQTKLTKTGNGWVTLTTIISTACGGPITVTKEDIAVGKVQPGPITFYLIDPTLGKLQAGVDPIPGATSYNWYKNGVLQTGHGSFIQMPITRNQCNIYYDISVAAISGCGTSLQTHANAYVPPCNNAFTVSPNPASNSINITPATTTSQLSANNASNTIDAVRIYDLEGMLKKYQEFNKATLASINIQGLANGTYFIQITSGTNEEKQQLIIQK